MLNFFQRRRILLNTNALDLVPIRKHKHELNSDGLVTILIPKFKNEKFARFFIPTRKSIYISIHLDEIGSAVWLSIDGIKDTAEICKLMVEKFEDKIQPVEERVVKFLSGLYNNKHITFKQIE